MSLIFKSHGKLLITGEYFILKGAKALCVPTNYYQSLKVNEIDENILKWKSFDNNKNLWLQAEFLLSDLTLLTKPTNEVLFLQKLLLNIKKFNSKLFNLNIGYDIESSMNFNKEWGLGSSSTLISNLSKWAKIDPFDLLWSVSNGSGYDIASSIVNKPILYQLNNKKPILQLTADFLISFVIIRIKIFVLSPWILLITESSKSFKIELISSSIYKS